MNSKWKRANRELNAAISRNCASGAPCLPDWRACYTCGAMHAEASMTLDGVDVAELTAEENAASGVG